MPNIQISDEHFQRLSLVAQAAGYQDVSAFIASFASEPVDDPRGPIDEDQLRKNVDAMEPGEAEIAATGGHYMKETLTVIASKYGL
jgi:thioredoxin-like negative regulator of GroEL